jgi:O-acetyl-ADP-ribose deacetylase (regulator of RNase III)
MIDHAIKREKGEEIKTEQPTRSYQSSWHREEPKTDTKRTLLTKTGVTLQVCSGDITKENVDAIVNAANNSLMLGGGVAGAIDRAGGSLVQEECDVWTELYGRVSDGQCGLSTGGNMPCKWVIHAVGPVWHDGHRNEDQDLLYAVYNSLIMANDLKCESISFPGISSGIFGFPKERCAKIMFHAFFQYVKNFTNQTLKVVRFTNYDEPTWSVFVEEFDAIFGKKDVVEDDNTVLKVQDESNQ